MILWLDEKLNIVKSQLRSLKLYEHQIYKVIMLEKIIEHYKIQHQLNLESELADFSQSNDFGDVIYRVAYCQDKDGKKYFHQYRIIKQACEDSHHILKRLSFNNIKDFESLYVYLKDNLLPVYGVGKLYIYDAALRLGACFDVEPTKIYLHAGALKGAKKLNLTISKDSLNIKDLPLHLQTINPKFVEAILCIYKDSFQNGKVMFDPLSYSSTKRCSGMLRRGSRC